MEVKNLEEMISNDQFIIKYFVFCLKLLTNIYTIMK